MFNVCVVSVLKSAQSCPTLRPPQTVARQAPLSMGFSGQQYWSGLPFPSPGDLPDPGIEPRSPALQANSLPSEPPGTPINFLRTCQSTFHSGCTIMHSHQRCARVPVCPSHCQNTGRFLFIIVTAVLVGTWWYLVMAVICIK